MYEYNDAFYQLINRGSAASARELIPHLLEVIPTSLVSVLDVGCGAGAWLSVWKSFDVEVLGLDGDYVAREQLLINPEEFISTDLRSHFALDRKFTLVQSLEVAEHLPKSSAAGFVENLCRHSDLVMFSAATPGQGGENHINEQPYSYWRDLFLDQGYAMYDPLRQKLVDNTLVKAWYRYNTFVYLKSGSVPELEASLAPYRVDPNESPADISPAIYKARKQLIKVLPDRITAMPAIIKKNLFRLSSLFKRHE
jgi:SAM-dependent methyltransferase